MKVCPKCNYTVVDPEKRFCYRDGARLEENSARCSGCNAELGLVDVFCEYCGTKREEPVEVTS